MRPHLKRLALLAAIAGLWLAPGGVVFAQLSAGRTYAGQSNYRQRYSAFRQRYNFAGSAPQGAPTQHYYAGSAPQGQGAPASTQPAIGALPYRSFQPQTGQQPSWQGRMSSWQNERQWQAHPRWQAVPQGQRQPLGGWTRPAPHWQPRPSWQAGWPSQQSWQPGASDWTQEGSLRAQSLEQTFGTVNGRP